MPLPVLSIRPNRSPSSFSKSACPDFSGHLIFSSPCFFDGSGHLRSLASDAPENSRSDAPEIGKPGFPEIRKFRFSDVRGIGCRIFRGIRCQASEVSEASDARHRMWNFPRHPKPIKKSKLCIYTEKQNERKKTKIFKT